MKHFRLTTLTLAMLALSVFMSACSGLTSPQVGGSKQPLKVGTNQWAGSGAVLIAKEKGLFTQNGVDVDVVVYDSVTAMNKDLADGKLDGAAIVEADVVSGAVGNAVQIVWVTDSSTGGDQFVANTALAGIVDLRGKRVGFSKGGFGQVFVAQGLAQYGLSLADITPVDISPEQVPAAIAAGQIDAGHSFEPFISQSQGSHALFTSADTPSAIVDVVAFRTDVIQSRHDDVQKFVQSISDGADYWQKNSDAGSQIVADGRYR
jgi:NitT/TauT family transport system substrate-binding protein